MPRSFTSAACIREAGPLVRQMREQGLTAKFMSDDGVVTDELETTAGGPQYVKGVLMTFGADPRLDPRRQGGGGEIPCRRFRAGRLHPLPYASIQSRRRLNGAGANDPAKVAEWLKSHPVQTVMAQEGMGT